MIISNWTIIFRMPIFSNSVFHFKTFALLCGEYLLVQGNMKNEESDTGKSFRKYYIDLIIRPGKTYELLVSDDRMLGFGFRAVLITAVLYTFVYVFLILGGGQPFHPWLAIPPEIYYRYNVFFVAPSMFMGWILSAGVVQLISRLFSGKGSFEQTLSVIGFGISVASWSTLIHDLLTSFLGALHVISQRNYEVALNSPTVWRTLLWIQFAIYLSWFIVLFATGIGKAQGLKGWRTVLLGFIAFICYQMFFLIFNR
jgi:hypothetical protein